MPFVLALIVFGVLWYFRPNNVQAARLSPPGTVSGEVPINPGDSGQSLAEISMAAWRNMFSTLPASGITTPGANLVDGEATRVQSP